MFLVGRGWVTRRLPLLPIMVHFMQWIPPFVPKKKSKKKECVRTICPQGCFTTQGHMAQSIKQ
jgi:hypothetical protein